MWLGLLGLWLGFSLLNLVLCIIMMHCYSKTSSRPLDIRYFLTTLSLTSLGPIGILIIIIVFAIVFSNNN